MNADGAELAKFEASASTFWIRAGVSSLHLLNPLRAQFIAERTALAGSRVLDVGCGWGPAAEALARAGARHRHDLAPGMIEVARLHAAETALAVDTASSPRKKWRPPSRPHSMWSPAWKCSSTFPTRA